MTDTIFVGLDVHKATVAVAVAEGMRGGEVRQLGAIPHRADAIAKLTEKLGKGGRRLSFCYEVGPCGYGLHRQLTALGHECMVVAPSLIPMKVGDRVKTDRRDAVMLAKLHRAGELTAVWVPDGAHEAMRDLIRARADRRGLDLSHAGSDQPQTARPQREPAPGHPRYRLEGPGAPMCPLSTAGGGR